MDHIQTEREIIEKQKEYNKARLERLLPGFIDYGKTFDSVYTSASAVVQFPEDIGIIKFYVHIIK